MCIYIEVVGMGYIEGKEGERKSIFSTLLFIFYSFFFSTFSPVDVIDRLGQKTPHNSIFFYICIF